ncbi:30S ribosomal protein S7 [Methylacidimicrobium tartarophylax]|uniref:Small ribosomal subunit protein uS7 n=1 Tax=Methylacidimicrobium tartarophylax TaxID=1041768 RepID=A0A5E6MKW8_9BACT|nr:30S ribosomal protein S7 [Methylacidimicrobium tartarophylax]VVM06697.1 30S ribosomal protein S7 [Methylacidimicrobium tartarophylax]
MRRRRAEKRRTPPDPKYGSVLVQRMISVILSRGKKARAEQITYGAIEGAEPKASDPVETLQKAIDNVKPRLEVKSRRVGGATYQVPVEISSDRQVSLALRWILRAARSRKGVPMKVALQNELQEAATGQGSAVRKRDEVHKMAQANRAFAHLRY